MKKRYLGLSLGLAMVLVVLIVCLSVFLPSSKASYHVYPRGAVAADAKRCSEIGR